MIDLLIGKNVKYAASKTSATTETATSPEMLANGALGIYYKASTGLTTLVGAATALATIVAGADISSDKVEYVFAVGTVDSAYILSGIKASDVKRYFTAEAVAAGKQISFVGFDGLDSAKDLQIIGGSGTNGAIVNYDEASIGFEVRMTESSPVEERTTSSASNLLAGDNKVVVASKLSGAVVADGKFISTISTSGALVALAAGTVVLTKGSKVVTFGGNQTLAAGDLLLVTVDETTNIPATATAPNGTTTGCNYQGYRIAVGTTTTSITLDQPFAGETVSLAAITSLRSVTAANAAAGAIGIKNVVSAVAPYNTVYSNFSLASRGVIAGSVISYTTGMTTGVGNPKYMLSLENKALNAKGFFSLNDRHVPKPVSQLDAAVNYDLIFIDYIRSASLDASNDFFAVTANDSLVLAFPDAAYGAGDNETVILTIMAIILGTVATPIALVATATDGGGSGNNVNAGA